MVSDIDRYLPVLIGIGISWYSLAMIPVDMSFISPSQYFCDKFLFFHSEKSMLKLQQLVAASRLWFSQHVVWHWYDLLEITAAVGLSVVASLTTTKQKTTKLLGTNGGWQSSTKCFVCHWSDRKHLCRWPRPQTLINNLYAGNVAIMPGIVTHKDAPWPLVHCTGYYNLSIYLSGSITYSSSVYFIILVAYAFIVLHRNNVCARELLFWWHNFWYHYQYHFNCSRQHQVLGIRHQHSECLLTLTFNKCLTVVMVSFTWTDKKYHYSF